jgi:hypothetical protein
MSDRCEHGGSERSRKQLVAVIGGVGVVLAAPAAGLMAPSEAHAAPVIPVPQQVIPGFAFFGSSGLSAALLDPIFDIFGLVPGLNIFIGNGADGTATSPNGGNAGLLFGNGGNGFSRTIPGTGDGGNGGAAGQGGFVPFFTGSGTLGKGGNGGAGGAGGDGGAPWSLGGRGAYVSATAGLCHPSSQGDLGERRLEGTAEPRTRYVVC